MIAIQKKISVFCVLKKKTEFVAVKRKDGRFSVRKRGGGMVNKEEKVKFLAEKNLIKTMKPKAKEAPAAE